MNGVKKALKFIGLWFILFWVFIIVIGSIAGEDFSENVSVSEQTNITYSGSGTVNENTDNVNTDETMSITTTTEQAKGKYMIYSILGSFLTTFIVFTGADNNKAHHLKASIPALEKDVIALEERREHQLDQANRVLDKYLNHKNTSSVTTENNNEEKHDEVIFHKVKNAKDFKSVVETYANLNGNDAINSLMQQIQQVETLLSNKKQELNYMIASYNGTINSLPLSLFKGLSKLEDYEYKTEINNNLNIGISDEDLGI